MKSDTNTSPSVTTKPAPVKVTSPSPRNTRGCSSVDTTVPLVVQTCSNSSSVQISVKINSWELKGVPSNDECPSQVTIPVALDASMVNDFEITAPPLVSACAPVTLKSISPSNLPPLTFAKIPVIGLTDLPSSVD